MPVLAVLALASVGAVAGNIAVAHDHTAYPASGKLYEVDGHRLHIDCRGPRATSGTASPTVVLSNSLGGTSADWARVMDAISPTTRICAYDRAGQGWSEEASSPRDGIQTATELHTLLGKAGEHGPYVLAGYSTGGTYAMTYAARYPGEVAGMALLDSSSPEQFTRMPAFPMQYQMMRRTYGPLSSLSRTGLGQIVPGVSPLPAEDAAPVDAVTSAPKSFRNQHDEVALIPTVFRQAQALTTFGDRPLVVLTASATADGTEGWTAAQDALAAMSTNSVHRTVESSHVALVGGTASSEAVVRAIGDVVTATRTHSRLPAR
jgi:pimeloyl-ACP methyl ester carboxylesterase